MKFNRTDLIDRVKAEIARREQVAADRNRKAAENRNERLAAHLARTTPGWQEFATTIRTRIRKGQPIVAEDIPLVLRGGWIDRGIVDVWREPGPSDRVADVDALHTLLHLLEATTDEEITTSALERMGFRAAQLFRTR